MKVTVDAASLGRAIDWAAGRTGTQVPILSAIVLDATTDGALTASGFDYDTWAEQSAEAHVVTAGRVAVSGRLARAVAKALPHDGRVDLDSDGVALNIVAGRFAAGLPLMPVEDYPSRPAIPGTGLALPPGLGRALTAAVPLAADHEEKETVGNGCGCELALEPRGVRVTAISRYRLFTAVLPWPRGSGVAELAALPLTAATVKAMAELLAGDDDEDGRLGLPEAGQNVLAVTCGPQTLGCRTSGGKVLDWRTYLAAPAPARSLGVDAAELADLVKRLVPTNDATDVRERRHLRVDIGGGALRLATERAADAIDVALDGPWDAEEWPMLIDSAYLLDIVSAASAATWPTLRIDFTKPNQAWRVTRPDSEDFAGLVMPIRIPKEAR